VALDAPVLFAANTALKIEGCLDLSASKGLGDDITSKPDFLDAIPFLPFGGSGQLDGPPKQLLILLPHRASIVMAPKGKWASRQTLQRRHS
jgi:hypothetical protein